MATSEISIRSVLSDTLFKNLDESLEDLRTSAIKTHGDRWSMSSVSFKAGYVSGILGDALRFGLVDVDAFLLLAEINRAWMSYGMGGPVESGEHA